MRGNLFTLFQQQLPHSECPLFAKLRQLLVADDDIGQQQFFHLGRGQFFEHADKVSRAREIGLAVNLRQQLVVFCRINCRKVRNRRSRILLFELLPSLLLNALIQLFTPIGFGIAFAIDKGADAQSQRRALFEHGRQLGDFLLFRFFELRQAGRKTDAGKILPLSQQTGQQ